MTYEILLIIVFGVLVSFSTAVSPESVGANNSNQWVKSIERKIGITQFAAWRRLPMIKVASLSQLPFVRLYGNPSQM